MEPVVIQEQEREEAMAGITQAEEITTEILVMGGTDNSAYGIGGYAETLFCSFVNPFLDIFTCIIINFIQL